MPATAEQAIQRLEITYTVTGAEQTEARGRAVARAHDDVAQATGRAERATAQMERQLAAAQRGYNDNTKATQQMAAANDNLVKSFADTASSVLETAGHLKLLAVALYAMFPAVRALVSAGIAGVFGLFGASAGVAAAAMGRVVSIASPALAFFTRLSIPVLAAVGVFKLLGDTVERGTSLLEKYGGVSAQRAMFGTGVDESLAKLTRFQDETVSAQQLQYATQLGSRLEEAKRTIGEFFKVQLDLTDPALKLQNAWVLIHEAIAKVLSLLSGPSGDALTRMGNAQWIQNLNAAMDRLGLTSLPEGAVEMRNGRPVDGSPLPTDTSAAEAFELAKKRLAAGMGGGFVGRFNQSIMDLANPPKIEEIKAETDAWTRFADQVVKATAARQADTQTVGLGAQAHEQLRTQLQGEAILERDGVKDTEARRQKLAELAKQAGETALAFAQANVKNRIDFDTKTLGLSDQDRQIAQALVPIYGNKIPEALASAEAAQMRFNNSVKQFQDITADAFKGFRDDINRGIAPLKALENQLVRISDRIVNLGLDNLIKSATGSLFGGGASGDLTSSFRAAFAGARQDASAEYRASYGDFSQRYASAPGQAGLSGTPGGYAVGGLAAVGAGIGAYQGGVASASPAKGALGGALAGGLSGAGIGFMFGGPVGAAIGAGIGAVVGGVAGFFGGTSGQKQAAEQQRQQNQASIEQSQNQLARVGLDTTTREGALKAFNLDVGSQRQQLAVQSKYNPQVLEAQDAVFRAQLIDLNKQWDAKELADKEAHLKALSDLRQSYDDRYFAATTDTTTLQGALLAKDRAIAEERSKIASDMADALPSFDRAAAAERLQIENDFAKKAAEAETARLQAVTQRQQSFGDQLFAVLNDTSTLQGQLAAIDLQTQREREAEQKAGGEALVQYDIFAAARRLKIITDFNQKAVDAEKQAADQRQAAINSAAKNIVNYLNGLISGSGSTLSPQDKLAAAQSTYNAQLALAQGGNLDAQGNIASFADNLEKAARDFYASGAGYQAIRSAIIADLGGLPAVGGSTDPVVNAIRDSITAIHGTTTAVNVGSQIVDDSGMLIRDAVDTTNTITQGQNAILGLIQNYSQVTADQTAATASSTDASKQLLTGIAQLLDAIRSFNSITNGILDSIATLSSTQADALNIIRDSYRSGNNILAHLINIDDHTHHMYAPGDSIVYGLATGGWVDGATRSGAVPYRRASGGPVGTDTVPAWLTPGEFVLRQAVASANAAWLPEFNRTGRLSMPSTMTAGSYANDNGRDDAPHFEALARTIVRASMAGTTAQVEALREENAMLRNEVKKLTAAVVSRGQGRRGTDVMARAS